MFWSVHGTSALYTPSFGSCQTRPSISAFEETSSLLLTFTFSLFWCCNDQGHSRRTAQGEKGLLRGRDVLADSLRRCPMRVVSGVPPIQEAAPRTSELGSLRASIHRYICMLPSIF